MILSDDLDMKAVAAHWPIDEVVLRSLAAGADAFLACESAAVQHEAEQALVEAMEVDPAITAHVVKSVARVRAFRATLSDPLDHAHWSSLPLDAHAALAEKLKT